MKRYQHKGVSYSINELAEKSGVLPHTIRDRLRRGYSIEEAVKPMATQDSVKEFCEASHYEDWIGMSTSDLHKIYWNWSIRAGYSPISKQGFSRQVFAMYPFLKVVPTKRGDKCYRVIRMI